MLSPFWRVLRHMVGRTPGKWPSSGTCLQSVIDRVLLSNGSAHFGSESERHSQHLMARPARRSSGTQLILISDHMRACVCVCFGVGCLHGVRRASAVKTQRTSFKFERMLTLLDTERHQDDAGHQQTLALWVHVLCFVAVDTGQE